MHRLYLPLLLCTSIGCGTSSTPTALAPEERKGEEIVLDRVQKLKSRVPSDWEKQEPSNKMRHSQFRVPRVGNDEQDAELLIFFFGEGGGGGAKENIQRWQSMFEPPTGQSLNDISRVEELKVGDVVVTYLDIRGTYMEQQAPMMPNSKRTPRPNYRRLGVVFASTAGPYFFTLTGPERTVTQHKTGFDNWLKSFH